MFAKRNVMASTIDEISIDWTDEDGTQKVKQLRKEILTKGAWTTILFAYQELDAKTEDFGPVKFRVGRYQKRNERFSQQSKFNISSVKQAKQVVAILEKWIEEFDCGE